MALSKLDKEKQLRELTSIVTGIRLFNKDCGKGGAGIDDREWKEEERVVLLLCVGQMPDTSLLVTLHEVILN